MALVDYSDSESEVELEVVNMSPLEAVSTKRKRDEKDKESNRNVSKLPPLPSSFHSLYATNVRTSTNDDPDLHGGRRRQVPHIEGNWPTHVYLEWYPSKTELQVLQDLISQAQQTRPASEAKKISSLLHSDLGAQLPLHISLSAPLVLQTDQRSAFEEQLEGAIAETSIHPFSTGPTSVDWVKNSESSRSFLVLRLTRPPNDELNRLLQISNECTASFEMPLLYEGSNKKRSTAVKRSKSKKPDVNDYSSAFHISIAWQLDEVLEDEKATHSTLETSKLHEIEITFDTMKAKIGNIVKDIAFH